MDVIKEPGKFEGEPTYVPYLWDLAGDGAGETIYDYHDPITLLLIADSDVTAYPELANVYAVVMWESEAGFVHHHTLTTPDECDDFRAEIEKL